MNANLINTVGCQRKGKEFSYVLALPLPFLSADFTMHNFLSQFSQFFSKSQILGAGLARDFTSQRVRKKVFNVLKSI